MFDTKDGNTFIGRFKSHPCRVVAVWNVVEKQYIYSMLQVDLFDGKWQDAYFESVYVDEDELLEFKEL